MFNHQLLKYYSLLLVKIYNGHTDVITQIQVTAHRTQYIDHLLLYIRLSVLNVSVS